MRHFGAERGRAVERDECHIGGEELGGAVLVADPDLLALREAAAREKEAFMEYRHHGMMIGDRRLASLFHQEAGHEAGHFIELCRMMSRFDPGQAFEFRDHGLPFLAADEPGETGLDGRADADDKVKDPERWLADLRQAVDLELRTLNHYQHEAANAVHPEVMELFTRIMNHEKEDLAIFIRELQHLLHRRH